jgi:hypothetical protein
MKYKGIELKEFTSDKPVVFDPPKKMFVCDTAELLDDGNTDYVYAYVPAAEYPVKTGCNCFSRCAEIPEALKPRRATNLELAKWLANGNGQVSGKDSPDVWMTHTYTKNEEHNACDESTTVRKWGDAEWHEPTANYMGLEE